MKGNPPRWVAGFFFLFSKKGRCNLILHLFFFPSGGICMHLLKRSLLTQDSAPARASIIKASTPLSSFFYIFSFPSRSLCSCILSFFITLSFCVSLPTFCSSPGFALLDLMQPTMLVRLITGKNSSSNNNNGRSSNGGE